MYNFMYFMYYFRYFRIFVLVKAFFIELIGEVFFKRENQKKEIIMNFSKAFEEIKKGKRVKLKIWSDYLFISQYNNGKLYLTNRYVSKNIWLPTDEDLNSENWVIVDKTCN